MLHEMTLANEPGLRLMLAGALERIAAGDAGGVPARQNRRTPLIEAALETADDIAPDARRRLAAALGLLIGTEGFIAAKDVLQLSDDEARRVKRWAIRALIDAARRPS